MKVCSKCKEEKDLSEFYDHPKGAYDKRPDCKSCTKTSNRLWREQNPRKKVHRKKAESKRVIEWVTSKYDNTPCLDCGGVFPWCSMDFDHRPNEIKEFSIGQQGFQIATPHRIATVEKEIAKCDLVCSNCHRIRTHITRKQNVKVSS